MSEANHVRSTTGLSPHRKQQRFRQLSCVSTRGLVPVFSPNPSAGGAASCSPAGPVEQRQRGVDDEVRRVFCDRSAFMSFTLCSAPQRSRSLGHVESDAKVVETHG